jgi:hypothetical protein
MGANGEPFKPAPTPTSKSANRAVPTAANTPPPLRIKASPLPSTATMTHLTPGATRNRPISVAPGQDRHACSSMT